MKDSKSRAQGFKYYAQLKVVDYMKKSWSWDEGSRFYTQVWAFDGMKGSRSSAQGFRCYEQLGAVVDMNDFGLWAQGSRYYEQLRVVDGMIESGSCDLKPLYIMHC